MVKLYIKKIAENVYETKNEIDPEYQSWAYTYPSATSLLQHSGITDFCKFAKGMKMKTVIDCLRERCQEWKSGTGKYPASYEAEDIERILTLVEYIAEDAPFLDNNHVHKKNILDALATLGMY